MEKQRKGWSRKVMVGIDESEFSYEALIWVLDNLKESFKDNPLVIFATQSLTNYSCPAGVSSSLGLAHLYCYLSPTIDLINQNQQQNMKVSLGLLEKSKKICARRGVKVKTFTEGGDPKEVICNAVEEHNIDLLVLGDKSRGIFERALLGSSLSDYCLSKAKCPVLVVKKA
ncbi:universal stress protein A-like protein [Humulus lupulus]|uniref:universal stress protein A-like protein n=1 Tax=Humulus lupulus TaxID=3486 RepID=UPI002B40D460|nr:universal stress protein A-like protein [Humulus lupulus]